MECTRNIHSRSWVVWSNWVIMCSTRVWVRDCRCRRVSIYSRGVWL